MTETEKQSPPERKPGAARATRDRRERIRRARRAPWGPILAVSGVCLVALALLITRQVLQSRAPANTDLVVLCEDAEGRPLEGIAVAFFDALAPDGPSVLECKSDGAGRAVLPVERADGKFFCVGKSEALGAIAQCFIEQGDATRVLTLAPPEEIPGRVEDEEGIPVPLADVEARLVGGPVLERTQTDDAGRFVLRSIPVTTLLVQLTIKHLGHQHAHGTWYRKSEGELVMTLARTRPLRFRVVGPEGAPAAGLPIRILGPDYKNFATTTDARGACEFHGLELENNYFVLIEHPSLTYRWRSYSPKADLHVIRMQEPATLEGIALDAGATPRPGVELRHRHGPRRWVRTRSDDAGRFAIGDLPDGVVELFWDDDTESGTVQVEVEGARVNRGRKLILR